MGALVSASWRVSPTKILSLIGFRVGFPRNATREGGAIVYGLLEHFIAHIAGPSRNLGLPFGGMPNPSPSKCGQGQPGKPQIWVCLQMLGPEIVQMPYPSRRGMMEDMERFYDIKKGTVPQHDNLLAISKPEDTGLNIA